MNGQWWSPKSGYINGSKPQKNTKFNPYTTKTDKVGNKEIMYLPKIWSSNFSEFYIGCTKA